MSKRIISVGVAIALMIVTAALTFSITMVYSQSKFNARVYNIKEREAMYQKIAEIDAVVRQNYIGNIDETNLNDYISAGFIAGIGDKYASYYTAETYERILATNEGTSVGIGVGIKQDESGYILITSLYENSTASEAGVMEGDLIIKVGDIDVTKETYSQAVAAIGGEEGTTVTLTVRRDNEDLAPIEVLRKRFNVVSVTSKMLSDTVGYIRISEFNNSSVSQFKTAVNNLEASGAKGIVFDLRNNGGGTILSVCEILDIILPEGPIAYAKYKDGVNELIAKSDASEMTLPMTVLTNGKTASAAELFTQALKDYNKAQSVGTRTYGKGVMQSAKRLNDGSAINITVATYNPPKSQNYDGVGIAADFEIAFPKELESEMFNLSVDEDPQLSRAFEIVNTLVRQSELS
jgi:carboxyl-terminal processing protease